MKNINKVTLELNLYEACRTNTGRASTLKGLMFVTEYNYEELLNNLDWCAKNEEDDMAINNIRVFAEGLLSNYEITRSRYHKE